MTWQVFQWLWSAGKGENQTVRSGRNLGFLKMTCRLARRNSPQGILANNDRAERTRADPARGQLCVSCWEALGKWQQEIGSPVLDIDTDPGWSAFLHCHSPELHPEEFSLIHLTWNGLRARAERVSWWSWNVGWLEGVALVTTQAAWITFPRLWGHRGPLALLSTLSMCQREQPRV